jgi:hypothetical protein
MPHLPYSLLLALLTAAAVAMAGSAPARERIHRGAYVFLCCVLALVVGSWTMYLIHR